MFPSRASMDGERLDQPSRSRNNYLIAQVKDIHADHWVAVLEVAEETGKSIPSCHTILTEDSGMHHVTAKFMPRILTKDLRIQFWCVSNQMKMFWKISPEMRLGLMDVMLKQNVIHHCGRVLSYCELSWFVCLKVKTLLIVFFYYYGIVHCEFIPEGQMVRWKFWYVWGIWFKENDQKCGPQERGTSIMTVHQLTQHVVLRILGKEFNSWPSTYSPFAFFLFPQNKSDSKRKKISNSRGHQFERGRWSESDWTDILWTVLPEVEKATGTVQRCSRKLFWSG